MPVIKNYIEIRCFDSQPYENMLAVPAMIKGIFYDSDSLSAAWQLVKDWSWEQRVQAYNSSHKHALKASIQGISLNELAIELISIAKSGLLKQNCINEQGLDESIYLKNIEEDVKNGLSPADKIIEKWETEWSRDIHQLINHCSYNIPNL